MRHKTKHTNRKFTARLLLLAVVCIAIVHLASGCASERYMLDEPVNDPIMFADDQQDSDLVKVEEGGGGSAGGGCPT